MKIVLFILAAILIIFGVLFIIAAFGPTFHFDWFVIGLIGVIIGFVLIFFATRIKPSPQGGENVVLKVDLPANVQMDTFQCKKCGGNLTPENIKLVAGAPVVTCPYCNTSYQLTEEPKW